MLTRLRVWLRPPIFEGNEEKTRLAAVLNSVLLILAIGAMALVIASLAVYGIPDALPGWLTLAVLLGVSFASLAMMVLIRRDRMQLVGWLLCSLMWVGTSFSVYGFGGLLDITIIGYFLVVVLAALILGEPGILVYSLLALMAGAALYYGEVTGRLDFGERVVEAFDLIAYVVVLGLMALIIRYAIHSLTRALDLARNNERALNAANRELAASRDTMEMQTAVLRRRARYVEATAAAARDATLDLGREEMLPRMARLVSEQLGFYHVGIFFVEPGGEWLVLQAASSEGGQRMLARGHRLRMGQGVVGYAAEHRRYRVLMDVGGEERGGAAETVFVDNPDLPDTRSEAALPLVARGSLIGVLDVQSTELNAFSEEDVLALQVLANQLAVAIHNARLYREAQRAAEVEREVYGELSRQAWQEIFRLRPELSIVRSKQGLAPTTARPDHEVRQALKTGQAVAAKDGEPGGEPGGVAVPIRVRGQVIGAIDAHKPAGGGEWTPDQIALIEMLCEQLGDALDDARMYEDAQRRAAREQVLAEVAGRVRESLDVNVVLQRAVQEMRQALGMAEVEVRLDTLDLHAPERPGPQGTRGPGGTRRGAGE